MNIHVCIGTEPRTEMARKVLQHSIRRKLPVGARAIFHPMSTAACDPALAGLTGFSLQRWLIPFTFPHLDRAIYMDADQLVFADLSELWRAPETEPHPSASVWCTMRRGRPQTSVMVIDCARARQDWPDAAALADLLAPGKGRLVRYRRLMRGKHLPVTPVAIDSGWNDFDRFMPGETRLLHFTRLATQPWRYPAHPHADLWGRALMDAVRSGAVARAEIERELDAYQSPTRGNRLGFGLHPAWRDRLAGLRRPTRARAPIAEVAPC